MIISLIEILPDLFLIYMIKMKLCLLDEIDNVIANKEYDLNEVEKIMICLKENGFDEWKELD